MKQIFSSLILTLAFVLSIASAGEQKVDAIRFLVKALSKDHRWTNGEYNPLSLPSDAPIEQLVVSYLKETEFKKGKIEDFKIEEMKTCELPAESNNFYKIVRISSDQGGKFLIFRYEKSGWWTKHYDAKAEVSKAMAEQARAVNAATRRD
ncbi:MAG: hypothetical protein ACOYMV_11385 [Verrucomicrobiia bacterium]